MSEKKTFGRTNNLIIEFVHLLALAELSRPRRAVVIPKKMASMPFDLADATSSWTCAFEQPPRGVSATIVEAGEAFFVQPANLGRTRWKRATMHAFEREVLRAIMLRPSARLSQRVDEFVERELGGAAYDALHLRPEVGEGSVWLARQTVAPRELPRGLTARAVSEARDDYLDAALARQWIFPATPEDAPLFIAHDRSARAKERARELGLTRHVVVANDSLDVHVDMQLLIRARRFVGNPASTVSMNVNAVRDEPLTSNLIVVRNSGRRTPCKKQYDAPGCTGIYSFPIDRSPDARDS